MSCFTHAMPRASRSPVDARIAQIRRKLVTPNASSPDAAARGYREEA